MLKVYGRSTSDNVQKVLWMLGETRQPFEHIQLGGSFGGLDDPDYLALNPHGRIPTLDDDGTVVWESSAIIRYLAAQYCPGSLWPESPAARASADQWMSWEQSTLYRDFNGLFWLSVRTPTDQQDPDKIESKNDRLSDHYRLLDGHLSKTRFVAGDHLTMGDIPIGMTLFRYFNMPIHRPELPNVEALYRRLCERDAYQRAVMVSFDELRGRLAY